MCPAGVLASELPIVTVPGGTIATSAHLPADTMGSPKRRADAIIRRTVDQSAGTLSAHIVYPRPPIGILTLT